VGYRTGADFRHGFPEDAAEVTFFTCDTPDSVVNAVIYRRITPETGWGR
jgi:hypothetical protein